MINEQLEQGIMEYVPQIPFVVDQVVEAINWAREALSEGIYHRTLNIALDVAKYANEVSDPNFYKTHLLLASILCEIDNAENDPRFEKFKSPSQAIEKAIRGITVDDKLVEERGCFKAIAIHLAPMAKTNGEYLTIALIGIKHDLLEIANGMKEAGVKTPITPKDYITVLGYANVMANLRMSNLKMLDSTYEVFNSIEILLNNSFNY